MSSLFCRTLLLAAVLFTAMAFPSRALCFSHPLISAGADKLFTNPSDSLPASHGELGISYLSNNVYLGRQDSVKIPYLSPRIGYFSKSGIFVQGEAGFLVSGGSSRLDMVDLSAGYAHGFGNYYGSLTASKYFFSSQSTSTRSEMQGSIEWDNSYDLGFITPLVNAAVNFGNQADYSGSFGLTHDFSLLDDALTISPTLMANASTQNYYSSYYRKRRYAGRRLKGGNSNVSAISAEVLSASMFKVLDYEISLPLQYEWGRLQATLTPVYAIPVNPAQVQITRYMSGGSINTHTVNESISNVFYGSLELVWQF